MPRGPQVTMQQLMHGAQAAAPGAEQARGSMKQTNRIKMKTVRIEAVQNNRDDTQATTEQKPQPAEAASW
jgi:hypothetical protein